MNDLTNYNCLSPLAQHLVVETVDTACDFITDMMMEPEIVFSINFIKQQAETMLQINLDPDNAAIVLSNTLVQAISEVVDNAVVISISMKRLNF